MLFHPLPSCERLTSPMLFGVDTSLQTGVSILLRTVMQLQFTRNRISDLVKRNGKLQCLSYCLCVNGEFLSMQSRGLQSEQFGFVVFSHVFTKPLLEACASASEGIPSFALFYFSISHQVIEKRQRSREWKTVILVLRTLMCFMQSFQFKYIC